MPPGTVNFSNGTTILDTGTLNDGILGTTHQAGALATVTTSPLPAGTCTFTATYAATGSAGALTEIVAPTDLTASARPTSLTITAGDVGAVSVMA